MILLVAAFPSAIINHNGRQIALDASHDASPLVRVGDVPLGSGPTLYTSTGDMLGWVALAGLVFFAVLQNVVERRAKKAAKASQSSPPE